MKPTCCDFCGLQAEMIFVHSHYQCPRCGINVAPCCQGEQCEWEDPVMPEEKPKEHSQNQKT